MATGHASLEAMNRMISTLTKFMTLQEQVKASIKNDYAITGTEWHDEKYQELEGAINDVISAISASYVELSNCQTRIQVYRRALEDYLNS